MIAELFLDAGHAEFLPATLDEEVVGSAHEDEQDGEADRRHDHRLDQSRTVRNRRDVAEAGGGDRDHGEIDHVEEAHLAVEIVDQAFSIPPVDHHDKEDQQQGKAEPDSEIAPNGDLGGPPQWLKPRPAINASAASSRSDRVELLLLAHPRSKWARVGQRSSILNRYSVRRAPSATRDASGRAARE